MRLNPFDVLLIGILVYMLIRMALGKRGNRRGPQDRDRPDGDTDPTNREQAPRRQATEAYERAQRAWDMLRGDETTQITMHPEEGVFDEQEFLAGAKAMCARIRQSWDARDLEDLNIFCTPRAMAEFERRAATETRSARNEPLLIEASLVERANDEDGFEKTSVLYRILEKTPSGGDNRESREIWRYIRHAEAPGDMWRLDDMRPVDDAEARPQ